MPIKSQKINIKVGGITRIEDATLAVALGAFALGFIFYEKSRRYIDPAKVRAIIEALPPRLSHPVRLVGVFVNAAALDIREAARISGIDTIQLHGDETPLFCEALTEFTLWKAFRLKSAEQFAQLPVYAALPGIEGFLFDAAVPGQYGGTGHKVDWDLLEQVPRQKPLIVSGGLHPGNIHAAWQRFQPYALDLSSGVECSPGIKDADLLTRLFAEKG